MDENDPWDEVRELREAAHNADIKAERGVDELIGICKGILSDGMVIQTEAEFILKWLDTNRTAINKWPGTILYSRVQSMLLDGKLDADEQRELLDLLLDMTGEKLEKFGEKICSSRLPLDEPQPLINFSGRSFCFTGKFVFGSRDACQQAIRQRGGVASDTVNQSLDYLVIGSIGSENWRHSTHGRKIEKAMGYREKGFPLAIVSEEHWSNLLKS